MQRSYKETISRYEALRQVVFEFAESEYSGYGLKFSEISYKDAQTAETWAGLWKNSSRAASWEWTRMYHSYHSNAGVKRFDIAIKHAGQLVALCYGVPSHRKMILKLHALERSPLTSQLNGMVLEIMLFAATAYARMLGSNELWLCEPVSPAHVRLYSKAGYEPKYNSAGNCTHLTMRLTYE
ncbi:hypothetical protein [Hahella ganghwensis]|uniref:hypothetical protein n=1 Tax=Hahella ganghwensis TaxID=286420 RepID=UPI00036FEF18|nr:hypothetical protein [Hahella ganghwensis]